MRHVDSPGLSLIFSKVLWVFWCTPYFDLVLVKLWHNCSVTPAKLSLQWNGWFPSLLETALSCGLQNFGFSSDSVRRSVLLWDSLFVLVRQLWKDSGRRRLTDSGLLHILLLTFLEGYLERIMMQLGMVSQL